MIVSAGLEHTKWGQRQSKEIILRWREKVGDNWERREQTDSSFRPYLFVDPDNLFVKRIKSNNTWRLLSEPKRIPRHLVESTIEEHLWGIDVEFERNNAKDAKENSLLKVYLDSPNDTYRFRKNFTPTFEADVPYEDRYLVDRMSEIPMYKMRKLFIDLEALQFRQGDGPEHCTKSNDPRDRQEINVIGVYDSYTKQYTQWCQHENFEVESEIKNFEGYQTVVYYFEDERALLQHFVNYVDKVDPDCLLAWGMGFYDLPSLYRRLESNGIGGATLSPSSLGSSRNMKAPQYKGHQYRWTEQPIIGRIVISLDRLFERIYKDSESTNLPSMKLDVVGQTLFGRGKTTFRPGFYDKDYDKFIDDYLRYNFRDVQLMVEIEDRYNAIEGQQALQQLSPCQFKSTFYGSNYGRVYFMRKADFKQKSGWSDSVNEDEWKLSGAIVFDPEELNSVGLHKNVVMLDFAGLYPSMMEAFNASFETKVEPGEERSDDIIGDGCRFRREPIGLLPRCVKELDGLRDDYKNKRAIAGETHGKASEEYKKWDNAQKTVKRLRATFYGLMAFQNFAWSDIDIARTITYGGRMSLTKIMEETERLGYKVLYGHTDSIMIALGDDKTPEECAELSLGLADHLTKLMQKELKSEAVEVEAEILMDRFFLPRRNRYAGRIIWDPSLNDPHSISELPVESRIKIQGLEAKHANTAEIGRHAQYGALKLIWADRPSAEVLEFLQNHIENIRERKVPVSEMIARGRLGKWLPSKIDHPKLSKGATNENTDPDALDEDDQCYKVLGGHQKGAAWYNVVLADETYPPIDKGDSYYYTFVEDGETWIPSGGYIAFQDLSQIEGYKLDIETIIEKNVISNLDHIMYGIGLSNEILRNPHTNLSVEDFL